MPSGDPDLDRTNENGPHRNDVNQAPAQTDGRPDADLDAIPRRLNSSHL